MQTYQLPNSRPTALSSESNHKGLKGLNDECRTVQRTLVIMQIQYVLHVTLVSVGIHRVNRGGLGSKLA
jgi:hypothetical protein